jgi:hypothetical protein
LKHFEERVKFYNEEKFSFSTTTKGIWTWQTFSFCD